MPLLKSILNVIIGSNKVKGLSLRTYLLNVLYRIYRLILFVLYIPVIVLTLVFIKNRKILRNRRYNKPEKIE